MEDKRTNGKKGFVARKPVPMWYIYSVIALVIYGTFSLSVLGDLHGQYLYYMNMANLSITFIWIFYNIFMCFHFVRNNYALEGIAFSAYYVLLNVLNAFNLKYGWIESYNVLRNISIATKVIEVSTIVYFLSKRKKIKKNQR